MSQKHTQKDRYDQLTAEMQGAARRLVICGMHVHVGIDDDELRIDLMNQMSYFLPHLLALSCSSPFWLGRDTGLKSYRLTIFDALPRTGIPERFASWAGVPAAHRDHAGCGPHRGRDAHLVGSQAERTLPDAGDARHGRVYALWTIRGAGIAAGLCLLRMLWRLRHAEPALARVYADADPREPLARDALQLRRRADRSRQGRRRTIRRTLLDETSVLSSRKMPSHWAARKEVKGVHDILTRGTSAHRQLRDYGTRARLRGER